MEPTFKTEALKELEDLQRLKQGLQQGLKEVQEAFLDIIPKMECVLSMYKVYDARTSSITKKIMESPEYELEPEPTEKEASIASKKTKTSSFSPGESSETRPQISVNPKLQTLKISFGKEFVRKEEDFPLLSEKQKLEFETDYKEISHIIYSRNSETVDSEFLVDFKAEFPKVIIHDADKLSGALIKSLYDLGYVSRIYFKDLNVLKFLPKPIVDAVLKFKLAGDTKMVTCLKIWKTSPKYSAISGELIEISPARQLNMKFKKEKGEMAEFDSDFIARRRAFSLVEYWKALSKRVIQGNGWTYAISEKLVVMCYKDKPFQEPVLRQLAAFARKIELLQIAGSTRTRRYLCQNLQKEETSTHKCNYCRQKDKCTA
ncbi:uncharacterized protein G2W53_014112 [Senna tora]|uniref:Uncharacterized protein n=1 Tax=Senna tora TaxID=362788 RepID=A0A834U4Y8_9FABA|nr:uncharacterized protein G2W53_014112 [Senna tora]